MKSYVGRSVQPRQEQVVYACACGERFKASVWRAISAADAKQRRRLFDGDLNRVRCPHCDTPADVQVSVLVHDEAAQRLIYVAPPADRHRELAVRAELFTLLAADLEPPPAYVLAPDVVFGAAGLLALYQQPKPTSAPEPEAEPELEATPPRREDTYKGPAPTADSDITDEPAHLSPSSSAPLHVAPASTAPLHVAPEPSRPTMVVPDPRTAVIERWIAAREPATALFVDDNVVVLAALPNGTLEQFLGKDGRRVRISLRPQLHRLSSFPLLSLTFVADEDGERPDDARVVHIPLDLSRAAHRVALEQLQRRCTIDLELFDSEYLPVISHKMTVPFEDHIRHLVVEAKQAMEKLPISTRDFDKARAAFQSAGYDRLGRTAIDLPSLDDVTRGSPAQLRAALAQVARWSEGAAESYLLEIRGYPLAVWRKLYATTVRRAVEVGLFVSRNVAERAVRRAPENDALDLPPWAELVELQIRRFAELSAKLRPSDLLPADEAANWELLLREADSLNIPVDDAVSRLAESAFQRAGGRPSRRSRSATPRARRKTPVQSRPMDVSAMSSAELLGLLEDRDLRLEAAIALARRREAPTLAPLFTLLRRMSRAESSALLPHLVAFGAGAERWLIDGTKSKQAFMRQGCALALGRLASALAIDALLRLLFEEPTEIWSEVARALGDVGGPAVMPLAARLRDVDDDITDRAVHALAHIAARSTNAAGTAQPTARAAVESLANGRDALIANVARRALALAPEVLHAHEAVRKDRREQTLVRAFTRRFYDVLRADNDEDELDSEYNEDDDIPELDPDDLLAFEAEPDPDGEDEMGTGSAEALIEEVSDARIALAELAQFRPSPTMAPAASADAERPSTTPTHRPTRS